MSGGVIGSALALLLAAPLPPPPEKVVRETKMFGTVTIDHRAHLQRRSPCRSCHGPGKVGKFELTPRVAHDRCRGCHMTLKKGPTDCRACHVVPVKPPEPPVEVAAAEKPEAKRIAEAAAAAPVPTLVAEPIDRFALGRGPWQGDTAEIGMVAVVGGLDGVKLGPSFQLVARAERLFLSYTIGLPGGAADGRMQMLLGGGRTFPLTSDLRATAAAVGGIDALREPLAVMPAVGARVGIEKLTGWPVFPLLGLSFTTLTDLGGTEVDGERTGGTTFALALSAGLYIHR